MIFSADSRALGREFLRRQVPEARATPAGSRLGDMMATRFDRQLAFIRSPARRKAAFCTRRAGKTESAAAYIYDAAERNSDTIIYYVAITRQRAVELMWKPLKSFNARFALGGRAHETLATIFMPNGAEVRLTGADKLKEADKKRGDKCSLVLIDEAQMYPPEVMAALVDDIFGPTLEDVQGTIVIMGTPGVVCAGYWYDVTRNESDASRAQRAPGWDVHEWSVLDNPHMAHMRERLPEIKRERGWTDDTPTFNREWLGRWVNDASALFYSYAEDRNAYTTLPERNDWRHVIGVDLGFDDAFALVVWAFSPRLRELYAVHVYKKSGLMPSQWAQIIDEANETYSPVRVVVDAGGLGKAFVEEMRARNRLPVEPAEKKNKKAYVQLLNDDLRAGRVFVPAASDLAQEWRMLPKDPDDPEAEDPRFPNHCSDAALYGWREARHWMGSAPKPEPEPGSREADEALSRKRERDMAERIRRRQQEEAEHGF